MGLLGSNKKTYVSSVTYPMGEDGAERTDFLKYTVLNANMQGLPLSETIATSYLKGQGIKLRSAFNYAREKYTHGLPVTSARLYDQADREAIRPILEGKHPGSTIDFLSIMVGTADYEWFAERYLAEEFGYDRVTKVMSRPPIGVDANANVAYDLEDNGKIRILLMNANGTTRVVDYRAPDLSFMSDYVHCAYRWINVYELEGSVTERPMTPGESNSITTSAQIVEQPGGETHTTTTQTTIVVNTNTGIAQVIYRKFTEVRSRPLYFLYRLKSGTYPALDAWVGPVGELDSPYFPSVPLRINNKNVSGESSKDTPLYKTSKRLLDKVGIDIDDVSKNIHENPQISEIDFAFVVFAVDLSSQSPEGKRYVFDFMSYLRGVTSTSTTKTAFSQWQSNFNAGLTSAPPGENFIEVYSQKERTNNYDTRIKWNYIDTQLKSGQIFPGAKPGDCDNQMSPVRETNTFMGLDVILDRSSFYVRRQIDENTYEEIEVNGLVYENKIYKGKSVYTTAWEAFHDKEESNSFLLPLHQGILRTMPLRYLTDLAYQVCHLVLNCYKVVKKKWYQTGVFKAIMVIVSIVLIVFTWGAYTPVAAATMASAFVAVGISFTLAVVLAATIYVLGMMILMNLLMKVATRLFGPTWGAVITIIVSFLVMNWGNIGSMMSGLVNGTLTAAQVVNVSSLVLNAYGAWAQGQMSKIQKEALGLETEFDKQMKEIEELTKLNLSSDLDMIDIQGYTQATWVNMFESPDTFFTRTLMLGSDIAALTSGLVTEFADLGLRLPTTG